jgi:hypothetical protein
VEEVGLRALLSARGVGRQLSRVDYEAGQWAPVIMEAYKAGLALKAERRAKGVDLRRQQETKEFACQVLKWIQHRTQNTGDTTEAGLD